jgi:hypothetical protein
MPYPPEFECPISLNLMKKPVVDDMGMTYDEESILEWLARNPGCHPVVRGRHLDASNLRQNFALKSQIERYLATAPVEAPVTIKPFQQQPLTVTATRAGKIFIDVTPPSKGERQPIAMFVALDNSGSMGDTATTQAEGGGFTRMDLCKHTLRTLAGMLGDHDILCLTTFSTTAKLVMKPTLMTAEGKAKLESLIPSIQPDSQTNIWAALELLNRLAREPSYTESNVVAALLTDGMSNVDPPRGILNHFKDLPKPEIFNLSTFAFGNNIDSNVLNSLSTLGNGSFGYIPDYSMVATVFINWAASVLSTAATNQTLFLTHTDGTKSRLETGLIQLGQSRSFVLPDTLVSITHNGTTIVPAHGTPSKQVMARVDVMDAITECILRDASREPFTGLYQKYAHTDALELVLDIKPSTDPAEMGQVLMAPDYYTTWGKHYLRAYLRAQQLQQCMNFKDHGLQIYGGAMFRALQKEGDTVFAHLPPLEASGNHSAVPAAPVNMASVFNNPRGGCWAPDSLVLMANGTVMPIELLHRGNLVWTPIGTATVEHVVKIGSRIDTQPMCKINDLVITPYHPVLLNETWQFPADIVRPTMYPHPVVYNLVLNQGHVVRISGILSCTLGHGFTGAVIEHDYFGNKQKVLDDLSVLPGFTDGRPTFVDVAVEKIHSRVVKMYETVLL